MNDEAYMRLALQLASKGEGWVSPNPLVGALIVKDGDVIGRGWHETYGQAHAERNALANCSQSAQGATMYVTLEPCVHHGKQPPCTDAIIEAGISRVVIGSHDPNPLVSGKGIQTLQEHGIEVTQGVCEAECDTSNEVFLHYIRTQRPFVVMKYAMTLDGKIATHTGASRWVTGEVAREHVHTQRHRYSAIMAGVGTILTDDPLLTCRLPESTQPVRIVCDTHLRTPVTSRIVATAQQYPTILLTCCTDADKHATYKDAGCRILVAEEKNGRVDLDDAMRLLGQENIDSILLEGGGTLNWSALESGIVHKVQAYIAPKLFGGQDAKTPIEGLGISTPAQSPRLHSMTVTPLGEDFLIEGEVESNVHRNS